jgi:hypothetical protein
VDQNVPRDKWWNEQATAEKLRSVPELFRVPRRPNSLPRTVQSYPTGDPVRCELNSCAMPMARAGHGIAEGCGYRAGRRVFVPFGLDATPRAADSTVFRPKRDYPRNPSAGITVDPYWSGSLHSPQGVV